MRDHREARDPIQREEAVIAERYPWMTELMGSASSQDVFAYVEELARRVIDLEAYVEALSPHVDRNARYITEPRTQHRCDL